MKQLKIHEQTVHGPLIALYRPESRESWKVSFRLMVFSKFSRSPGWGGTLAARAFWSPQRAGQETGVTALRSPRPDALVALRFVIHPAQWVGVVDGFLGVVSTCRGEGRGRRGWQRWGCRSGDGDVRGLVENALNESRRVPTARSKSAWAWLAAQRASSSVFFN